MYNKCECPYCSQDNTIEDYEGDSFDKECQHCGREFVVNVEYEPIFSTNEINYDKCSECGREERTSELFYKGSTCPYPEKYKDKKDIKLCRKCYCKGIFKDMEE